MTKNVVLKVVLLVVVVVLIATAVFASPLRSQKAPAQIPGTKLSLTGSITLGLADLSATTLNRELYISILSDGNDHLRLLGAAKELKSQGGLLRLKDLDETAEIYKLALI